MKKTFNKKIIKDNINVDLNYLKKYFEGKTKIELSELSKFCLDNGIKLSHSRLSTIFKERIPDYKNFLETKEVTRTIISKVPTYRFPIEIGHTLLHSIKEHGRPIEKNQDLNEDLTKEKRGRGRPPKKDN